MTEMEREILDDLAEQAAQNQWAEQAYERWIASMDAKADMPEEMCTVTYNNRMYMIDNPEDCGDGYDHATGTHAEVPF